MTFKEIGFHKCKTCKKELRSAADYGLINRDGSIVCPDCMARQENNSGKVGGVQKLLFGINTK